MLYYPAILECDAVWSGLALLHQLGSVAGPAWLPVPLTPALLPTLIYVVTYVAMDPVAGGAAAALMLALHGWTAGLMAAAQPVFDLPLWQAVLAFHVTMWVVQFIGHGVFEVSKCCLQFSCVVCEPPARARIASF